MDSISAESRENVDIDDSNTSRTLYKAKTNVKCDGKERINFECSSVSFPSSSSTGSEVAPSSTVPLPPDGGWGWVVVFASFMINFIADGVSLSFGILFVDFVDYFGESKAKTSWVGSIFLSMPLLAGPVASYLIDRYGCRKMCVLGALLATVSFICSVYAESLELLFFTFTMAGLGLALCYVASIVIVAYYFEKKRSLATGLAACGTGIGTFVLPPFTIYLLEEYAWKGTLLIFSGLFLNMVVFGALMRDLEIPSKQNKKNDTLQCALDNSERLCSSMVQLPTYLHDNCPEVISELSSKEGTYLSSLLQQHPYILDSIIEKRKHTESSLNVSFVVDKKKKKIFLEDEKEVKFPMLKHPSIPIRLDAAYLNHMKVQRGSITYRGAMLNIHRYRLKASSCPDIYRNSMVTISEDKSLIFFHDLKDLMMDMFDFTNFKNFGYTIFCVSNFLLYACVDVPYVYIPDHAHTRGTNMESASFLISILGVLNCLGVVMVGYIGDKPWLDSSLLYSCFISLSGLSLIVLPIIASYYLTAVLVAIYGFTISANYTLVPVIIVNLISLDNFTGAYGLLLLVQGIASLIGPPVAGALFDATGNYNITFYCTGIFVVVSGAMVLPVAKSLSCHKRASPASSKDLEGRKLRFQEPVEEPFCSINSIQEMKALKSDSIYSLKNNVDNFVPLLCVDQNASDIANGNTQSEPISIFENPLSIN